MTPIINNDLIQDLEEFCSPSNNSLSPDGLRSKLQHILSSSTANLAASHFLHILCTHPQVTVEMIDVILNLIPYMAYINTCKYHGRAYDPDEIIDYANVQVKIADWIPREEHICMSDRSYPIHIACASNCPSDVIVRLIKSNPAVVGHACLLHGGCRPKNHQEEPIPGLPLHYYFVRSKVLDLEVVKCLVEAHPESLDGKSQEYHPIHALMENPHGSSLEVVKYITSVRREVLEVKDGDKKLPLHLALENEKSSAEVIELLIKTWPDCVYHQDSACHFPLRALLSKPRNDDKGFISILNLLLDLFGDLLHTPSPFDGKYPIHVAASCQSPQFIKILVDAYPEGLEKRDGKFKRPFHHACQYGTPETVEYIYNTYPKCLKSIDIQKLTPIHLAATRQNDPKLQVLKFLLDKDPKGAMRRVQSKHVGGQEIVPSYEDSRRYHQFLPLHYAAENKGTIESIRYLCNLHPAGMYLEISRANPLITHILRPSSPYIGLNPIKLARLTGNTEAFEYLQDQMMGLAMYRTLPQPLLSAIMDNRDLCVVKLLASEWPEEYEGMCDSGKNSCLHHACLKGRVDIVNFLLEKWPMYGMGQNEDGKFPLELMLGTDESSVERDGLGYVEAVWRLLVASPQVMKFCM